MARPIVVGYDPRTSDRAPVRFAVAAARLTGARLLVVSAHAGQKPLAVSAGQTLPFAIAQVDEDLVPDCTVQLQELEDELQGEGVTVECRAVPGTSAARALHDVAEEESAGLLVVGSSRRGEMGRVLPGSTAERVIAGAPCPVAVVPQGWTGGAAIQTIGAGFENTEEGREAVRGAWALARRSGARLRVICVVKPRLIHYLDAEPDTAAQYGKDVEDVQGEHLARARAAARAILDELGGDVPAEVDGFIDDPADVLVRVSERLELLVCGSRGYGPLRAVMLGGVTRRVVAEAHCPVIVLPRGAEAALEALLAEAPGARATA